MSRYRSITALLVPLALVVSACGAGATQSSVTFSPATPPPSEAAPSDAAGATIEAGDVGTGEAIISTGGRIIHGSWSKDSIAGPTLLFGPDGRPVTLTAGQTFVQVIALSYTDEATQGTVPGIGSRSR